jgi:hypothetical protein
VNAAALLLAQVLQQHDFASDLQAFQFSFISTVAANYTLSAALDGVPGFQVGGATAQFGITAGGLSVPSSSLQLKGADGHNVSAGSLARIVVTGKDEFGAMWLFLLRLMDSEHQGQHCTNSAYTNAIACSDAPRLHGCVTLAAACAGNFVQHDFTPQMDAIIAPAEHLQSSFTADLAWDADLAAPVYSLNITAAGVYDIAITSAGAHFPGSPMPLHVLPKELSFQHSTLTGAGLQGGEPGFWNPVSVVPRDTYGNTLLSGALDPDQLQLASTPAVDGVGAFQVSSTVTAKNLLSGVSRSWPWSQAISVGLSCVLFLRQAYN